jgi:hypothetical protein
VVVQVPVDAGAVEAGLDKADAGLEFVPCAELGDELDDTVSLG